jgi:hypothetical protein
MTTAWGKVEPDIKTEVPPGTFHYLFAVGCGVIAGWVDVQVGDLLLTALLVLAPCMLLGMLRPQKPWRWVALVCVCVPAADLLAFLLVAQKPSRGQVYASLLSFLPGIAGAYGGAMMRGVIDNLSAGR